MQITDRGAVGQMLAAVKAILLSGVAHCTHFQLHLYPWPCWPVGVRKIYNSTDKAMTTSYIHSFKKNNNVELRDGAVACTWSSTGGLRVTGGRIGLIVAQIKTFLIHNLVFIISLPFGFI